MFNFSDKFLKDYLPTTIELGRSFVTLLVLQNLLAVFKLPDLLQDFLPFFFLGLGCIFFVHVMHLFSLKTLID